MFVILLCIFVYVTITLGLKSVFAEMEELQQEMHKLHSDIKIAENMNLEMQDLMKDLELEKQEQDKRITITRKKHELDVSRLTGKIRELESILQELKETTDLKQACIKDTRDESINVTTSNSEELMRLQGEIEEAENAYSEFQMVNVELQAQNTHMEKERDELLMQLYELQSKLALKMDAYNESIENVKNFEEENALMKIELETLKGEVDRHLSKGNSLFAEVEDNRLKLKKQISKHKAQLVDLQKHRLQTTLTLRRLLKEKARICEDLAEAKEKVSREVLQFKLAAYKERLKDLETAQKAHEEEKAAIPVVLGNNYESIKKFDHKVKVERDKSRKLWERYEDIMMRYIAMTDEAVALKSETVEMERMKQHAEVEIVKLKQEIEKKGEGDCKGDEQIPVVEVSPLQEIQNTKKCRFAPETIEPSSRKLIAKKETNKIPYLTSS